VFAPSIEGSRRVALAAERVDLGSRAADAVGHRAGDPVEGDRGQGGLRLTDPVRGGRHGRGHGGDRRDVDLVAGTQRGGVEAAPHRDEARQHVVGEGRHGIGHVGYRARGTPHVGQRRGHRPHRVGRRGPRVVCVGRRCPQGRRRRRLVAAQQRLAEGRRGLARVGQLVPYGQPRPDQPPDRERDQEGEPEEPDG
jgi:hypothetical protein